MCIDVASDQMQSREMGQNAAGLLHSKNECSRSSECSEKDMQQGEQCKQMRIKGT